MSNNRILIFLLTMALTAASVVAQVKIAGKVFDQNEQPIEFATVRILGTAIGVNTDTKGLYEITVPERDTIMVEFSCIGYSTVTRQLIKPKGTVTLSPKLYEKSLELGEVVVTEYKKQTGGMQSIDIESTRIAPDASGNAVESTIQTMAGVTSKNELSSQ